MRPHGWLTLAVALGLACAAAPAAALAKDKPRPQALGSGPAYETLGHLAVLHQGRLKPLDTVARQTIKQIYGADMIKLPDPPSVWGPVGAYVDMVARPEFWDEQPIIRVDHLKLKSLILSEPIRQKLRSIAARGTVSAADRKRIEDYTQRPVVDEAGLLDLVRGSSLNEDDRQAILSLADRLKGDHRWVSPKELETAVIPVDGQKATFDQWLSDISSRMGNEDMPVSQRPNLSDVERRAYDAGIALRHYQAVRGDRVGRLDPLDMYVPRPHNAEYLKFTADVERKQASLAHDRESLQGMQLTPLESNADDTLREYLKVTQRDDWKLPGEDKTFDARFTGWLKEKAGWIPMHMILEATPEELAHAGYPASEIAGLRDAYKALIDTEIDRPGQLDEAHAAALVQAARKVGEQVGGYPTRDALARETFFNAFAPFYKASVAYGLGLVLLLISLAIPRTGAAAEPEPLTDLEERFASRGVTPERRRQAGPFKRAFEVLGMAAFVTGIVLEVVGFYFRVRISGWAPVTNMYETVIWVALVAAVLGLVFELIFQRTFYLAIAASGVAFLTTLLANTVSLLDPNIKSLTPVLRSNYWLSIHVLTEVSSYAAFALAMALGMIATAIYLTATYRRNVDYLRLAKPLLPGVPLLALGGTGVAAVYEHWGPAWVSQSGPLFYSSVLLGLGGGVLVITSVAAMVGEALSRYAFAQRYGRLVDHDGRPAVKPAPASTSVQTVTVNEGEGRGAVATLTRPTVAEIRALAAASRPQLDARGLAMQATAAQLKPLSNFIYRTIQVGVLLITAGTFLGGMWADVSWGRFWGWDPKEVWALITLLLYLIPLHGRFAGWINPYGLVAASVVCFLSVVMAWYGVNFVLGVGLHSYGFTEGGGQGVVVTVCCAVVALVIAAGWRRGVALHDQAEAA